MQHHVTKALSRHVPACHCSVPVALCCDLYSLAKWLYMCAGAMQYFGIKDTDVPAFAIHDATSNAKYMIAKASPEDLTSFVAEFEVSSCQRHVFCNLSVDYLE